MELDGDCNGIGAARVLLGMIVATPAMPSPLQTRDESSDDRELLSAIAERKDRAFERLVTVYQDRLFGLAWRVTQSYEDAEEAAQDAFVKAHRALYREYSSARVRELRLRPWLF